MFELLPSNEEAEQGLLGCLLKENSVFFDVYGTVKEEDFYTPIHGEIFAKIQEFIEAGRVASPVALKNLFDKHPSLENLGGAVYMADLASNMVSVINATDYARQIADLSERRRLLEALSKASEELKFFNSSARPVEEIKSEIMAHTEISARSVFTRTKREVAADVLKSLQSPPECFPTGIESLDTAMNGGMYPGFTYGFGGAAKRGKTTLAHTISHNLNQAGVDHAYIALEMGANQIEARNVAREIGVSAGAFYYHNPDLIKKAVNKLPEIKNHTLYLDMAGASFNQIKAEITRLVMRKKVKGFVVDYWQLVQGVQKGQSKADFLYDVAQWFANFARRHKVWCILLAQLNDDGTTLDSRGLQRACDQLYNIEKSETGTQADELWLSLKFSRYTPTVDIGSVNSPKFWINPKGPFFDEIF
ncbi:DnaB Replicative DNA helicase [uncultured Caudovirales phage]|uniref:DNA 5'-3' helicase n=1 Tax=uncultured Caudovirales phage TaxID=2100421 RepID=A0A6J5LYW6_9CAUD|nr:DnaB Replicative DNA helicase [uncultured Caudovirales phage]